MQNSEQKKLSEFKIIIVDDVPSARRVITRMLERGGFKAIYEAANGEEAISTIRQSGCDLIISDWHMPKLSGIELLGKIQGTSQSAIPFLLVTSENRKEEVVQALKLGVADYICKPFSYEILMGKVRSILSISNQ